MGKTSAQRVKEFRARQNVDEDYKNKEWCRIAELRKTKRRKGE